WGDQRHMVHTKGGACYKAREHGLQIEFDSTLARIEYDLDIHVVRRRAVWDLDHIDRARLQPHLQNVVVDGAFSAGGHGRARVVNHLFESRLQYQLPVEGHFRFGRNADRDAVAVTAEVDAGGAAIEATRERAIRGAGDDVHLQLGTGKDGRRCTN